MTALKHLSTLAACAVLVILSGAFARGDATPSTGAITGSVSGPSGAAANISVKLFAAPATAGTGVTPATSAKPAADEPVKKHAHLKPVAETTTDDKGNFKFENVAAGSYFVVAGGKGVGHGKATASVTAGNTTTVSIELKEHKKKAA